MKKTIGIVTFHSAHNYGSVFQAYAMSKIMQKLGLEAKIIDYRHPKTTAMYEFSWWSKHRSFKANVSNLILRGVFGVGKAREKRFNDFIEKNMPLTSRYKDCKEIKGKFDYLVCGSDQIWNPKASGRNNPAYYLDFGDEKTVRFSYAASSGGEKFAEGSDGVIINCLKRMRKIGVREETTKEYIEKELGLACEVNPDPTFLLEQEDWIALEEPVKNIPENFLLVYSIRDMPKVVAFASEVGKMWNVPIVHINQARGRKIHLDIKNVISINNPTPGQFLWLYHKALFVVSNTFHGNMFSVIYKKNFIWYKTNPNDSRILTLHRKLKLDSRCQICPEDAVERNIFRIMYDEKSVNTFKQSGFEFIKACLE